MNSAYGQRGPNGTGHQFTIAAGQMVRGIRLIMVPTGAISGRISDNSAEPLANISVWVFKYYYANGQRTLKQVKIAETNDRGEYRLYWLPPGLYYVSAIAQTERADNRAVESDGNPVSRPVSTAQKLGETYLPTYYPGTPDLQMATPVEVHPGMDLTGIDFVLNRVTPRKIRGLVVGSRGQPATVITLADPNPYANLPAVILVPRGTSISAPRRTSSGISGNFEVTNVLPGSYFLIATKRLNATSQEYSIAAARIPIDIGSTDLDGVTITLSPAMSIAGRVILDGDRNDVRPIVSLKSEQEGIPAPIHRFTDGVGRQFILEAVIEGEYKVQVTRLPGGTYLKSVRFGAADALNSSIHIDSRTSGDIEIVLGTNAGMLEGFVLNKDRQPVPNATVALVPNAVRRHRADLYRNVSTDGSGRFHLEGIAPGDYVLFAWEDIEAGLWQDPEFIRRNEGYGKPIGILESSRQNAEVIAIPFAF